MNNRLLNFLFILCATIMLSLLNISTAFSEPFSLKFKVNSTKFTKNGEEREMNAGKNTAVLIEKQTKRAIIPLEFIANELKLSFSKNNNTYVIKKDTKSITVTIYDTNAIVDDYNVSLFPGPIYINGNAYIALRFIAENFGAEVIWNEKEKSILVKMDGQPRTVFNHNVITHEDDELHIYYNVELPIITNTANKWFEKIINSNLEEIYSDKIDAFVNSGKSDGINFSYSIYEIRNRLELCNNKIISFISMEKKNYGAGSSVNYYDSAFSKTIDLQSQRFITLNDLFNTNKCFEILQQLAIEEIIGNIKNYDELLNIILEQKCNESFTLTKNGLLLYNPETYSGDSDDKFEYIIIPYNKLKPHLKNEYNYLYT